MKNVQLLDFKIVGDERGSLIAIEENKDIPFLIKRIYYIYGVNKQIRRGSHAHKNLHQVLICMNGNCKVHVTDGNLKRDYTLNSKSNGLLIGPMVWREMYEFSYDCVLLVLANDLYDEEDYIRNFEDFINTVKKTETHATGRKEDHDD